MNGEELSAAVMAERKVQACFKHHIHVCAGTSCAALRSEEIAANLKKEVAQRGMQRDVHVKEVGCDGLCALGPMVGVRTPPAENSADANAVATPAAEAERIVYQKVAPEDAAAIVDGIVERQPVQRLQLSTDTPFFRRQQKIVLENCGVVDPERIEDVLVHGGYAALVKALTEMTPEQVVDEITKSGLRGRGGAGFPTGLKWATVAKSPIPAHAAHGWTGAPTRFVVCNGDEGDPGAFMDRGVMEGDPHRVIEGMIIAAYAIGASQGYVYVRAEYGLAVKRMRTAIRHAQRAGFLGRNICGTSFSFDIDIRLGAGAFVCGEETALMASIEGNRGTPRPRPPFPAESGLWGCPTLINNVETFANIAPIVRRGSDWFAAIGVGRSKGTKVFALTGRIVNAGLIEVPMGITLREIVFDIGGGIPDGRAFKAVQTGGPSGGCLPQERLDMPVDYESLMAAGSIMGSGGMIVMDDATSMIEVAHFFMEFCMDESCGKCIPCRAGTVQMHRMLGRFVDGVAQPGDIEKLESLCDLVKNTSLCGLGQSAPNPVLSTLRNFREEYVAKVKA
jgi:bidirectional [NiFe] hydrogenase diaphorase subunit